MVWKDSCPRAASLVCIWSSESDVFLIAAGLLNGEYSLVTSAPSEVSLGDFLGSFVLSTFHKVGEVLFTDEAVSNSLFLILLINPSADLGLVGDRNFSLALNNLARSSSAVETVEDDFLTPRNFERVLLPSKVPPRVDFWWRY